MYESRSETGVKNLRRCKIDGYRGWIKYIAMAQNELVDGLKLLMAEKSAGNQSDTNEIRSVFKEL